MIVSIRDFDHWRQVTRRLIQNGVPWTEVTLREHDHQTSLFEQEGEFESRSSNCDRRRLGTTFTVPRQFMTLAQNVAYHRDAHRWNTLYRTLWRMQHGTPHLLEMTTDDDVYELQRMEKQVRRDAHKTKAFVRFRKVVRDATEHYIAWHRPDHRILKKVGPFFTRRFKAMNWSILTPYESAFWDQQSLHFGPAVAKSEAPDFDELEDLWRTYYASIFNPARVKIKAMKNEMPVRFWSTMPETELIPDLIAKAHDRVQDMVTSSEGYRETAANYIEQYEREQGQLKTLDQLKDAAATCKACDLHCAATQTVFGEGPSSARIVLIGEQPGDMEDRRGRPFVGPAGKLLDEALLAAGIERKSAYVTNVVKHFKHESQAHFHPREMRGKRRLHKRPNAHEIRVCKPWLMAEWKLLKNPTVAVCLGSTAATSMIGPEFKVSRDRGRIVASTICPQTIATWHPSAILRGRSDEARKRKMAELTADLQLALRLTAPSHDEPPR